MTQATYFTAFREVCETHLKPWEFDTYCEPIRARMESAYHIVEPAMVWVRDATAPLYNHAKWTWGKTGEHYGAPGQLLLITLVAGIAYNLWKKASSSTREEERQESKTVMLSLKDAEQLIALKEKIARLETRIDMEESRSDNKSGG